MKFRRRENVTQLEALEPRLLLSAAWAPRVERFVHMPQFAHEVRHAESHATWRKRFGPRDSSKAVASAPAQVGAIALPAAAALVAPVASLTGASATQVTLSASGASGGVSNYTYQWYRGTSAGFAPSSATLLAGANSQTLVDPAGTGGSAGLAPGVPYFYVLAASDGQSTVFSNQVIGALSIPTAAIPVATQMGPTMLAYIGSSTWAINQGSGQVPWVVDGDLRAAFPGVNITTFNGAVSGTTTSNFLPGQPMNAAVKSALQNFTGYKVLRLMIGSNDAASGRAVSSWLTNMRAIIQDALTWPVDLIVLEEIGLRLDGGNATLDLIRQYNAARSSLAGPNVVVGTAYTFENEALHLSTLSGDLIHQTDVGQVEIAANQSAEIGGLFAPPTTFNLTADNAAIYVAVDATHTFLQISQGSSGGPYWSYALAAVPALSFNLLGSNDAIYFNFVPATTIGVSGVSGNHASLYVSGQSPSEVYNVTDTQITAVAGGEISYLNIAELHLLNSTFEYTGSMSTVEMLYVGAHATFYWN